MMRLASESPCRVDHAKEALVRNQRRKRGAARSRAGWFCFRHACSVGLLARRAVAVRGGGRGFLACQSYVTYGGRAPAEMIGIGPAVRLTGVEDTDASPRSLITTANAGPTPAAGASVQGQLSSPRIARSLDGLRHGMDRLRFDDLFSEWLNRLSLGETSVALADLRSAGIDAALADDLAARLLRHLSELNVNAALVEINTLPARRSPYAGAGKPRQRLGRSATRRCRSLGWPVVGGQRT